MLGYAYRAATAGSPCWPNFDDAIQERVLLDVFRADVTGVAVPGVNSLTGFPSGLTDGTPPQDAPSAFPLAEGASLVCVFSDPRFPFKTVLIHDGAQTIATEIVSLQLTGFNAAAPVVARTTYVVGDGQLRFPSDIASFNSVPVAGPGTGVKTADAFDGGDGTAVYPLDGLWDTLTLDVSSLVNPGDTTALASVTAGAGGDCLTYVAQVFSVTQRRVRGYRVAGWERIW